MFPEIYLQNGYAAPDDHMRKGNPSLPLFGVSFAIALPMFLADFLKMPTFLPLPLLEVFSPLFEVFNPLFEVFFSMAELWKLDWSMPSAKSV